MSYSTSFDAIANDLVACRTASASLARGLSQYLGAYRGIAIKASPQSAKPAMIAAEIIFKNLAIGVFSSAGAAGIT